MQRTTPCRLCSVTARGGAYSAASLPIVVAVAFKRAPLISVMGVAT